jgi:hypothetical protein
MTRQWTVLSLVLITFVGPRPLGAFGLHNNDDPSDNRLSNLRWGTPAENAADRMVNGGQRFGDRHHDTKVPDAAFSMLQAGEMPPEEAVSAFGISLKYARRIARGKVTRPTR